jgi:hypothetical protein
MKILYILLFSALLLSGCEGDDVSAVLEGKWYQESQVLDDPSLSVRQVLYFSENGEYEEAYEIFSTGDPFDILGYRYRETGNYSFNDKVLTISDRKVYGIITNGVTGDLYTAKENLPFLEAYDGIFQIGQVSLTPVTLKITYTCPPNAYCIGTQTFYRGAFSR